jgi:Co/Zn/Cd efflux system component
MATAAAPVRVESASLEERIDRMHGRDRLGAMAFVVALWVVMLFILFTIWPAITNGTLHMLLVVTGILVLLFNTAAIWAMLKHYREDKHFIYGLDLKHLDEMRRRRFG